MKKVIRSVVDIIDINNINKHETVGITINGTKYISVKCNGSKVKKMSKELKIDDYSYESNIMLLKSYSSSDMIVFDNAKEAINWLIV